MRRVKLVVVATLTIVLAGCSSFEEAHHVRTHRSASPKPPASGQTFYADAEGLVVRDQPSASGGVVGHLALHERVTRLRVHGDFALVTSSASGVKGWVENAQLIAHVPASSPAAKEASPPATATTPDTPRASALADPDPRPPPVLVTPEADPEPVPVKVSPGKPTPVTPKPEMLDPF